MHRSLSRKARAGLDASSYTENYADDTYNVLRGLVLRHDHANCKATFFMFIQMGAGLTILR